MEEIVPEDTFLASDWSILSVLVFSLVKVSISLTINTDGDIFLSLDCPGNDTEMLGTGDSLVTLLLLRVWCFLKHCLFEGKVP